MNNSYRKLLLLLISILCLCQTHSLLAYKQSTHEKIASSAAMSATSFLSKTENLNRIGLLNYSIDIIDEHSKQQYFPDSKGELKNILTIIQDGANFEDDGDRAVNHFFDPVRGRPLNILGLDLIFDSSPDWALEDDGEVVGNYAGSQEYSYKDARQYYYEALTTTDKANRDRAWGKTFETLGHVIHHIQDMAQPQHVRNDAHLDEKVIHWTYVDNKLHDPSLYEILTGGWNSSLPYGG